jgi:transcriptional regulator with XRE-family HTH domain
MTKLQDARKKANMTLEELAEAAGTSKDYVWQLETGRREPKVSLALKIADALGYSVEELFNKEGADDGG